MCGCDWRYFGENIWWECAQWETGNLFLRHYIMNLESGRARGGWPWQGGSVGKLGCRISVV